MDNVTTCAGCGRAVFADHVDADRRCCYCALEAQAARVTSVSVRAFETKLDAEAAFRDAEDA